MTLTYNYYVPCAITRSLVLMQAIRYVLVTQ
jgi:hypothetical protein